MTQQFSGSVDAATVRANARQSAALGSSHPHHAPPRFTIDGNRSLEEHLSRSCAAVLSRVRAAIPPRHLEAIVLGGGYGRGEGGVLHTSAGDRPYNDLEFYVFTRGSRLWNERRYGAALCRIGDQLSPEAGLHVEFKIESLERLRRSSVTMFSYDLVCGHRVLWVNPHTRGYHGSDREGESIDCSLDESIFSGCEHHLDATSIPLQEATRLLFNRCTGLLLAKELLRKGSLDSSGSDFIGRNLAKAQLAFGDVALTATGQYHWSCIERHERLKKLKPDADWPWLTECREHHQHGVDFKLHPGRTRKSATALEAEHRNISSFASQLWLWLESRRLQHPFGSIREYAAAARRGSSRKSRVRNLLLNARAFGVTGVFDRLSLSYPRERLLKALPVLLWEEPLNDLRIKRELQNLLRAPASDWQSLVAAYKSVWPAFG